MSQPAHGATGTKANDSPNSSPQRQKDIPLQDFSSRLSTALAEQGSKHQEQLARGEDVPSQDVDDLDQKTRPPSPSNGPNTILPTTFPTKHAWRTLLFQEIAHNKLLETQMLFLTIATGIIDAMTYTTYRVFVSKQTGNTLFLALYAFQHPSIIGMGSEDGYEKNVVVSFFVFCLGAALFGHLGHHVKQRRRIWLIGSSLVQTAMVYGAAALRYWGSNAREDGGALGVITLLAFASGGQIALALHAGLPELNTTMVTGALIQLATDRRLFALKNVARNRRVLFYLSLLIGCFIGASVDATLGSDGPALALLLCAITKTLVLISFLFNDGVMSNKTQDEEGGAGTHTPFSKILWGD